MSVKRFEIDAGYLEFGKHTDIRTTVVLAADYDALCDVVRQLVAWGDYDVDNFVEADWFTMRAKALALVGEKGV